jgi:hypothetical protein
MGEVLPSGGMTEAEIAAQHQPREKREQRSEKDERPSRDNSNDTYVPGQDRSSGAR